MPGPQYTEISDAVLNARSLGLDVTFTYWPSNTWFPGVLYPAGQTNQTVQFVQIVPSNQSQLPIVDGQVGRILYKWNTARAGDGRHDVLTYLQATLYLQGVGNDPQMTKRMIRELIAFSQGINGSTAAGSSIAFGNHETAFSKGDINAMQRMSGCTLEPTTSPGI
jgi:hypothetical protein